MALKAPVISGNRQTYFLSRAVQGQMPLAENTSELGTEDNYIGVVPHKSIKPMPVQSCVFPLEHLLKPGFADGQVELSGQHWSPAQKAPA